jgi:hypothetical protein
VTGGQLARLAAFVWLLGVDSFAAAVGAAGVTTAAQRWRVLAGYLAFVTALALSIPQLPAA